ncbi:GHMP family kinase ATP-binding protein, partial [Proteus terrae]
SDGKLVLVACDREEHVCLDAAAPIVDDEPLRLHRGIHRRIVRDFNDGQPLSCTVTTFADAPAGSGLGTSSTMVVSVLQAYAEWLKLDLTEYELANLAYQIEREDLALAGGKQ